jgi:hypothetical protein
MVNHIIYAITVWYVVYYLMSTDKLAGNYKTQNARLYTRSIQTDVDNAPVIESPNVYRRLWLPEVHDLGARTIECIHCHSLH